MEKVTVSLCFAQKLGANVKAIRNLKELEEKIGYVFRDKRLLRQAMIHSSYSNEQRLDRLENNERLEFLGDAVLEIITSDYLFREHDKSPEGELTKLRASIVCEQTLAYCTREIELGSFLLLGKGEDMTGGRERDSIISDAMEALIGAIYMDGGFTNAREFVKRFILKDIDRKKLFYDSKTVLQEIVQADRGDEISYNLIAEEGPDHNKRFVVELKIGHNIVSEGSGRTKKAAEQEAAYKTILQLKNEKQVSNVSKKH